MEIAKEYGGYWPGIEDAIKDGVVNKHYKNINLDKLREAIEKTDEKTRTELETVLGRDFKDVGNANYAIYRIYSTLPEDFYIKPIKGKFIKVALNNIDGKPFKNPITKKTEKLGKFPMWRDELFKAPDTKKGELRVVLGRHAYSTQSADVNNYLLLDLMNYNYVWINDDWAKQRGLEFKDDIIITNAQGTEIKAKVFPTMRIRKDTAYIATGFGSKSSLLTLGYDNGISQAEVCDNSIDPIIGSASMNETIITIKKV
jgi:thiosulfate reductase/polysulfide reductase chain A